MPTDQTTGPPAVPSPPAPTSTDTKTSGAQDVVLKVLGAVGTGVGILGFVTFFGGAILWIRAERAGLPANDAISVIPNSVLVTTGASFLVPAVLIALLAVTLIYMMHQGLKVYRQFREGERLAEEKVLRIEAEEGRRLAEASAEAAAAERALATKLSDDAEQVGAGHAGSDAVETQLVSAAQAQRLAAEKAEADALEMSAEAAKKLAEADNLLAASKRAVERTRTQLFVELGVGIFALLVLTPVLNAAIFNVQLLYVLILIGVALVATAASLVTYIETNKFIWFGVVSFITVGVYIGFATYFSTIGNAKVEPAAAIRTGRPPVIGIFVADTTNNLYIGTFPEEGHPSRLLVVPRAQVTDLAIGPLLDRSEARERATALALDQCRMKIETPKTATEPAIHKRACTAPQRAELAAAVG